MPTHFLDQLNRTGFLIGSTASPTGGTWTQVATANGVFDPALDGTKCSFDANLLHTYKNTAPPAAADESVLFEFTPYADNWQTAAVLRCQPNGDHYQVFLSSGGARVDRKTAGDGTVGTQIGGASTTAPIAAGNRTSHTFLASITGGVFALTIDGTPLSFSGGAPTDSSITAAGVNGWGGRATTSTEVQADTGSGSTPVTFTGTVPTLNATAGTPFSVNLTSYFSGTLTPFTYSTVAGSLPANGLSLSGSVISGTPTAAGTLAGNQVRATDAGSNTATTNAFSIVVAAAPVTPFLTITDLKNWSGTLQTAVLIDKVVVLNPVTGAVVLNLSSLTTTAGADLTITDAALVSGTWYLVVGWNATRTACFRVFVQAAV